jgi:hypothetical protein
MQPSSEGPEIALVCQRGNVSQEAVQQAVHDVAMCFAECVGESIMPYGTYFTMLDKSPTEVARVLRENLNKP